MSWKLCFAFLIGMTINAQAQLHRYSYQREIQGINSAWHSLRLPNEMFTKMRTDGADMRILGITANKDTIEAPYLRLKVEEAFTEQTFDFHLINTAHNTNGYYFTFEIPVETTVNQILLDFAQANFDWKVKVEGSQNQNEWFTLVENYRILAIDNGQVNYRFTNILFPDSKYQYIRICIKSKEKPAISAAKIKQITRTAASYRTYVAKNIKNTLDKKAKQSYLFFELAQAVPVSYLKFLVANGFDYYRPIQMEYLADSTKTEKGYLYQYQPISSGMLSSVEKNEFTFPNVLAKKFKITLDNADNEPLKIQAIQVKGSPDSLIARFTQPATYYLVYGSATSPVPTYDLAAFKNKIPAELSPLTLGKEQKIEKSETPATAPLFQNKAWLWGIMIAIIAVLGWFSMKMMR
ncbi:MAG: DUF3999 family protein, partial [Bacteroidia bacterium]